MVPSCASRSAASPAGRRSFSSAEGTASAVGAREPGIAAAESPTTITCSYSASFASVIDNTRTAAGALGGEASSSGNPASATAATYRVKSRADAPGSRRMKRVASSESLAMFTSRSTVSACAANTC